MRRDPLLVWAFLLAIAMVLCVGLWNCGGGHHGHALPGALPCDDDDHDRGPGDDRDDDRDERPCAMPSPSPSPIVVPTPGPEKTVTEIEVP